MPTLGGLGESIGALIEQINDRYSAQSGHDLFKATNKTAGAHPEARRAC